MRLPAPAIILGGTMKEYISTVVLEITGQQITDFKAVTEKKITRRKEVPLMGSTGVANVTPRYGVTLEYAIPDNKAPFDFAAVKNGTITITYENSGARIIYTGVCTLEEGEVKYDGDNDAVKTIDFTAGGRRQE